MADSTSPRGGFNLALMLAIIGIGLGGVALYLTLTFDPFDSKVAGKSPFRGALDKYKEEMKTAGGTAKAEMDMHLNRDFRAMIEYQTLFEEKQLKEKSETFKVEKEADFKREPDKDPKAKKNQGSGEFKILFVTFKEDGEDKKELMVMEKHALESSTGSAEKRELWKRNHSLSSAEVGSKNKDLAAEMDKWK
jgi:hypothetical protein